MATPNTAAVPGTYRAADSPLIAAFGITLTGTTWAEDADGNRYYLVCSSTNGAALKQVLRGMSAEVKKGISPFVQVINTDQPGGGLNPDTPQNSPMIKWLYSASRNTFYKVLSVVNDNRIEVEALTGLSPGEITCCGTRGYNPSSITINGNGGAVTVAGYQYNTGTIVLISVASGATAILPVNLDKNGPVAVAGVGTVTVNV